MTNMQILVMEGAYVLFLCAVIYFTRAAAGRVIGSLSGGAAAASFAIFMIAIAREAQWWSIPTDALSYFWVQLFVGITVSMAPTFLVIWRVVRRFGWRGLVASLTFVAIIGPPRDYLIAKSFPEWMVFSPGVVPVLFDAVTYVGMVAFGYLVMRWVAGPAGNDHLRGQH
jgi:hypothetical protein